MGTPLRNQTEAQQRRKTRGSPHRPFQGDQPPHGKGPPVCLNQRCPPALSHRSVGARLTGRKEFAKKRFRLDALADFHPCPEGHRDGYLMALLIHAFLRVTFDTAELLPAAPGQQPPLSSRRYSPADPKGGIAPPELLAKISPMPVARGSRAAPISSLA